MTDLNPTIAAILRAHKDAAMARYEAEQAKLLRQLEATRNALRETRK